MSGRTCFFIAHRCPRCGSQLASDGRHVWCTFVGGDGYGGSKKCPACSYGLDAKVTIDEVRP